ncbi:hypothetical protein C2G38_2033035 [Gigaspora rosea]|uniref:Uncharacterized protein n=1 Tax=Gigaspora rosea TaxID=44941 RepID=A0A397VKT8_9GLOM|nr:hypothetical protein C2G38_2033035 [Gigaspora rosea]
MICRSPVKRGRKALTVSEGHIDVTGRTHIMTVKRSTPLTPKKKTVKNINNNNNKPDYCKRCEQNDEYIDVLSERLDKLESLTQKIVDVTKQNDPIIPEAVNFSTMEIDDLIEFSNHLDVLLFKKADIPSIPNQINQIVMPQATACTDFLSLDWQIGFDHNLNL